MQSEDLRVYWVEGQFLIDGHRVYGGATGNCTCWYGRGLRAAERAKKRLAEAGWIGLHIRLAE